ncbi:hypothetical protein [Azohydromonas aeria]|uniref:hypothetical protein n=1 Tax=Azohydromonas aeria TaxID=2590212 RepID=UPI0012FC7E73|nr:hypothetical protein [Azohydromonas aeria]
MPDPEAQVPSLDALMAATLALMTRWADPVPQSCPEQTRRMRSLLARKIVSNLFFLQHHPAMGEQMGLIVANAHRCWQGMAQGDEAAADVAAAAVAPVPARGGLLH